MQWQENLPLQNDRRDIEVEHHLQRARRRVERRIDQAAAAGNPQDLMYDARNAAKRALYVAELSQPVLRRPARFTVARMTKIH